MYNEKELRKMQKDSSLNKKVKHPQLFMTVICFFGICLSLILLGCVHTGAYKLSKQVSINLEEKNNKLTIEFCNEANGEVLVPNYYLFDDTQLYNDYFVVRDKNGVKAEYYGMIGDFWQVDYISIPKGEKITREIALEDFYDIKPNESYKVQYSFSGLQSNCIEFVLEERR